MGTRGHKEGFHSPRRTCVYFTAYSVERKKIINKCMHSITSHHKKAPLQIDSHITMMCLFIGHFLTWRMLFSRWSHSFTWGDTRNVNLLSVSSSPRTGQTFSKKMCHVWLNFYSAEKLRKLKKKEKTFTETKSFCIWGRRRRKKGKPETDQWAARLSSSVSRRVHNYDMYLPICRSYPPS